ncbi:amino acid permease [Clostridium sediminicola]|uniref:amino acid permease n=1 Tax=Clostridium sediminicola TaxID=3114879 RepID=UPI0031F27272
MAKDKGLRTIEGVYIPTLLTVLGVILYLRLGWIVGNSGLMGALAIIGIAHLITIATTLSMSSMLTNIKIGAGGAYSIISQSLGLEMGGAIGIPLYFSQAISVAFYITGFTELWGTFFPNHSTLLIAFIAWIILAGLSMYSTEFAFKVQYFIFAIVIISLISFVFGNASSNSNLQLVGSFGEASFWQTFAIFFPAVTGILTGATMSGELQNPRSSIIKGTLGAVITGLFIYILVAYLFVIKAPINALLDDSMIILNLSFSKTAVVAGIMGAVLSSALSTLVSAPRTLSAIAENRSTPFYSFFAKKTSKGEPKNAIVFSSLLSLVVLFFGNLDGLATLLTLFFLTTYAMINLVVFIEKILGIVSFRPSFSVSIIVPIIGFSGCLFSMLLINKFFTVITILIMTIIYYNLKKRNISSSWGDVRGGIFMALAEWAAQKSMSMPYHPKLWKPSLIAPVEYPEDFKRITDFIRSLIYDSGRLYYLTINENNDNINSINLRNEVLKPLREEKLFAQEIVINGGEFHKELPIVLQSLSSIFLSPNIILFTLSYDKEKQKKLEEIFKSRNYTKMGLMCLHIDSKFSFGQKRNINLWLRDKSPNNNLAVLSAIQLSKNWNSNLTLCRIVQDQSEIEEEQEHLSKFIEDGRLPLNTKVMVLKGEFDEVIKSIHTDLHIMGMPIYENHIEIENMVKITNLVSASVVFVSDSGLENALV